MARRTTRRSISVKGTTYLRLKDFALPGKSMSGILEEWIHERLDAEGAPRTDGSDPRLNQKRPDRPPKPEPAENIPPANLLL